MRPLVPVRRSGSALARATAALALALGCRGDLATDPIGQPTLAPTDALPTLTGGVGTQIFPTVPSGERQSTGDARGLNASGQVTGGGFDIQVGVYQENLEPYRWTPGGTAVRISGCCDSKFGNDINDAGTVVGHTQTALSLTRGFVATGTTIVPLPVLPGFRVEGSSWAVAINNAGQIAGSSPGGDVGTTYFSRHAVLWSPSLEARDLGTLGGEESYSLDLNAAGQVIGWSQLTGDATSSFFLWSAGTGMVDLRTVITPSLTDVVEINDAGQIIGTYVAANGQSHAFLYTPGSGLLDLGTLGGTSSAPTGLNNRGDVVGTSTLPDGSSHAFLWTVSEGMEDITAVTGVTDVRRLNDNLQTLAGASRAGPGWQVPRGRPRLVQLQVTQSNAPPTALFTVECDGLTCVLDASGSLDDKPGLSYAWDVDKYPGNTATGEKVTVTYPHSSQRTVTLTVTDANGLTDTASRTFTPSDAPAPTPNQPPVAQFTWSCDGTVCTLDATSSTDDKGVVSYSWALGKSPDGTASGPTVTTDYWHTSSRYVTLTVTDAKGQTNSVTQTVQVP